MKKILILTSISSIVWGCSIFDNCDSLVGRTFDYTSTKTPQVTFFPQTKNSYSYASFNLQNPQMPYDGINDKGLFIAISAVPNTKTSTNFIKPIRKSLEMVNEVLKNAKNIDEAIKVFDKYSIVFGQFLGNPLIHYKIVQKDGKSAIIEFVDNKRVIIRGKKSTIMTNHYSSNTNIKPTSKTTFKRFDIIKNNKHKNKNDMSKTLKKVKQSDTMYSNIYDLKSQTVTTKYKNKNYKFSLKNRVYGDKKPYSLSLKNLEKTLVKEVNSLSIRPHAGYGLDGVKYVGFRALLSSNSKQSYGFEYSRLNTYNNTYNVIGIVLEQRTFGWFNASIGTVGYFDTNGQNSVGLVSNLGWEPDNHIGFLPFITYRNDVIFKSSGIKNLHSISVGFKFKF